MKKYFLIIIAFLTAMSATAFDFVVDDIYYTIISDNEVEVVRKSSGYSGAVIIPEKVVYEGTEYNVTAIGEGGFRFCPYLTSVEIPNTVSTIGNQAFSGCTALESIAIPSSVTYIDDMAFSGCESLTKVDISDLGAWCEINFVARSSNPLYFASLYLNGVEVSEIVIPEYITEIKNYTFCRCSSLTSLEISGSVLSIGDYAFERCIGLGSLKLGESVVSIGEGAFSNCSALTSLEFPNTVTFIGDNAFSQCTSLTDIEIPNSVTYLGSSAFRNCEGLNNVTIGDSVTTLNFGTFENCSNLETVELPSSLTSINSQVFYGCSSLKSIDIPDLVASVGSFAFQNCTDLTNLSLGSSVASLGDRAFEGCQLLEEITVKAIVPPTAIYLVFDKFTYTYATLYVPEKSKEAYSTFEPWNEFLHIEIIGATDTPTTSSLRMLPVLFPTETLKLCVMDEDEETLPNLSWSSSDSGIIKVNENGQAVAMGLGIATIVAATENGESASLEILVIEDDGSTASLDFNTVTEFDKNNIYSIDGMLLIENATHEEILSLNPGIYIIGGKKVILR